MFDIDDLDRYAAVAAAEVKAAAANGTCSGAWDGAMRRDRAKGSADRKMAAILRLIAAGVDSTAQLAKQTSRTSESMRGKIASMCRDGTVIRVGSGSQTRVRITPAGSAWLAEHGGEA